MAACIQTSPRLHVLSLGAGVQSTTLALMAAHGEVGPMPDCAIFADTGWEPRAVIDHLNWLRSDNVLPFPVHIVSAGNIREDILASCKPSGKRFASIPFFTCETLAAGAEVPVFDEDEAGELVQVGTRVRSRDEHRHGIGRRQCSKEFKIEPIARKQRVLLGYGPRQRIPAGSVEVWLGITTDEAIRMKPARNAWQINRWPLIERRMSRIDCIRWLERNGYPIPPKSSCIGCPFHSEAVWRQMQDEEPEELADAVAVDRALRANGPRRGMRALQYMHRSCKPLDEVDLSTAEDRGQLNLFLNECEGMCGV